MKRLLEAFAGDELHVLPATEKRNPEYQKLHDRSYELQEKLERKLNDEDRELLNKLLDTISEINCHYAQNKFIRGYSLGVLMTMEVCSEQDTFLCER